MTGVRRCRFAGTDLPQAYRMMLDEHPDEAVHLHATLPVAGTTYDSTANGESVAVAYSMSAPAQWIITLDYPGGTTTIVLRQDSDATVATTTRSAD